MLKLFGIDTRDCWGLVKDSGGLFYVLRPPFKWDRCKEPVTEDHITSVASKHPFSGQDRDFETFEDLVEFLEGVYTETLKVLLGHQTEEKVYELLFERKDRTMEDAKYRVEVIHMITNIIEGSDVKVIKNRDDAAMLAIRIIDGLEEEAQRLDTRLEKMIAASQERRRLQKLHARLEKRG